MKDIVLHIRPHKSVSVCISKERGYVFLDQGSYEKGGATVIIRPIEGTNQVNLFVSECSKSDNYCKKIGRDLAYSEEPITYLKSQLNELLTELYVYVHRRVKMQPYPDVSYLWVEELFN